MRRLLRCVLTLMVLTSLAFGCGTSGEKGANKDLDRPKSTQQPAKTGAKSEK